METAESYDVIVVGSGIGSLTTAVLLAKFYNQKVLVLEKHGKLGGYTHAFSRQSKYNFDVGLHYVGGMQPGQPLRRVMDHVTGGEVSWAAFPERAQCFYYPDFKFWVPSSKRQYKETLIQQFPSEKAQIENYFRDVKKVSSWPMLMNILSRIPKWLKSLSHPLWSDLEFLAQQSTKEYFLGHGFSEKLSAVLDSQWGDYGQPTGQSLFVTHAMVAAHYFYGAHYPIGGSQKISTAAARIIESKGGKCLIRQEACELLVSNARVVGVKTRHTREGSVKEYKASLVVSGVGAFNTYLNLLSSQKFSFEKELRALSRKGVSCLNLYLGLRASPASIGIHGENYWIYNGYDHDKNNQAANLVISGNLNMAFLSFASQNDPETEHFTAQAICPVDAELFAKWKDTEIRKRGDDYEKLKEQIIDTFVKFLEQKIPGIQSLIEFKELGTPLSFQHYTSHPQGQIYGLPMTKERIDYKWLGAKTSIAGLYLTGADVAGGGIAGAMMGGVICAAEIKGWKVFRQAFSRKSLFRDTQV